MASWKKVITEGNVVHLNLDVDGVQGEAAGSHSGVVIEFGSMAAGTTYTAGGIYVLTDSGWAYPDMSSPTSVGLANGLLGVAVGTSPTSGGFLLSGLVVASSTQSLTKGEPVYVNSNSTPRGFTGSAPTSAGDYLRIIGHCVEDDSAEGKLIMFNPSPDYVLIE